MDVNAREQWSSHSNSPTELLKKESLARDLENWYSPRSLLKTLFLNSLLKQEIKVKLNP